ncbi:MAG: hypothetical protein OXE56_08075 [Gammaproteobacteria bacterium]|nr:hypothetical protein [Gammaproteobacteria bacterium]
MTRVDKWIAPCARTQSSGNSLSIVALLFRFPYSGEFWPVLHASLPNNQDSFRQPPQALETLLADGYV